MSESYIPPPPAYEPLQQEFDQKTHHAVQISLASGTRHRRENAVNEDDDSWEWDQAAFDAAYETAAREREGKFQSNDAGSSSGYGGGHVPEKGNGDRPVSPLHIQRKTQTPPKEQPSWYGEAELGTYPAFQPLAGPSSPPTERRQSRAGSSRSPDPYRNAGSRRQDEGDASAPPPFTSNHSNGSYPSVVMSYHGQNSGPPSPLTSPQMSMDSPLPIQSTLSDESDIGPSSPSTQLPPHTHRSMPPPPRQTPSRIGPRPMTSYTPQGLVKPHMSFDPSVAYTRPMGNTITRNPDSAPTNAGAFYNSAVSSHLPTKQTTRLNTNYNLNRQSQYSQQQSLSPSATYLPNRTISPGYLISQQPQSNSPYPHPQYPHSQSPQQQQYHHPGQSVMGGVPQGYYGQPPTNSSAQPRWATSEYQIESQFYG